MDAYKRLRFIMLYQDGSIVFLQVQSFEGLDSQWLYAQDFYCEISTMIMQIYPHCRKMVDVIL